MDNRIKNWIDAREALTINELKLFIFGYKSSRLDKEKLYYWWNYVLKTKDLIKLREYKKNKINNFNKEKFELFKELYNKDERLRNCGHRTIKKVLENVYNIKLGKYNIKRFKKLCEDL